jgi:hypothetical protein
MDEIGVATLHVAQRAAARAAGHHLLDTSTDGMCACTAERDGRHYTPLIPHWVVQLAAIARESRAMNRSKVTSERSVFLHSITEMSVLRELGTATRRARLL